MGSSVERVAEETTRPEPTLEERLALIERVAASHQFSRSARLRDFLLYVGKESLKPGSPEIHEQDIGTRVFGRDDSYDRTSDTIVRVNATELRKRIDSYFVEDGADEPLIFAIPRGIYTPVFHWRQPADAAAERATETPAEEPEIVHPVAPPRAAKQYGTALWALGGFALLLLALCIFQYRQIRTMRSALHPWEDQPAVAAFWNAFLDPHRQTDVVLPDDSVSLIEDISGTGVTFGDYLSRSYMQRLASSAMSPDRKADVSQVYNHNLVTFGAVGAAQTVLSAIPANYPRYLTLARNFTADQINRNNVVLLGGRKAEPWDDVFDSQLNFVTDYDYQINSAIVRNRAPKPGEKPVYDVLSDGNLRSLAVLAYLPNPSHSGNVIILAGTDSDATGAAAAFLTSETQMERLRAALHSSSFPHFEALLKISRVSGTFFDAELVAFRIH